jgi:hypothetical protein
MNQRRVIPGDSRSNGTDTPPAGTSLSFLCERACETITDRGPVDSLPQGIWQGVSFKSTAIGRFTSSFIHCRKGFWQIPCVAGAGKSASPHRDFFAGDREFFTRKQALFFFANVYFMMTYQQFNTTMICGFVKLYIIAV